MATYAEYMNAARNADAAGDAEAARRLVQLAQQSQGGVSTNSDAVAEFGDKMRSIGRGVSSGATFGFVDELAGAAGAALGATPGSGPFQYEGTFQDRYEANRDAIRSRQNQSREGNPLQFGLGEVAGGIAQATASAPLATGATLPSTMARGGLLGGIEGSLYGAGTSDGENTAQNAVRGGMVGLGVGAAAPAAVNGLAGARDAVIGGVDRVFDRASQGRAARSVAETVRRSGRNADEISSAVERARLAGQPMYRAVDAMGEAGRRRLSGIVRSGPNADEIADFLRQRTIDAPDRMVGFTDEAFGLGGKTRQILEGQVKGNRNQVADALYTRAASDASPVDVRGVVTMLDDQISQMTNSGIKSPAAVKRMEKLRSQLAGATPDGDATTLSDYKSVLQVWRELRNDIDKMFKPQSGKSAIAAELIPVRDALEQSLAESSDLFLEANALYRRGSEVLEAFETGAQAAKRGRAADNVRAFDSLTGQEQRAARTGYGDETIRRIEGISAEAPNVSRQMASSKRRQEIDAFALNPERYAGQIGRESDMFRTFNTALGGSRTADNLQDIADVGMLADLSRAGVEGVRGNATGTVSSLFSAVRPLLQGQNEATQALVARSLLSRDPSQMLEQAVRAGQISDAMRRTIESAIRSYSRAASGQD